MYSVNKEVLKDSSPKNVISKLQEFIQDQLKEVKKINGLEIIEVNNLESDIEKYKSDLDQTKSEIRKRENHFKEKKEE